MTRDELLAEWADAAFNAQENWTVDPHIHIERLTQAGDRLRDVLAAAPRPSGGEAFRGTRHDVIRQICAMKDDDAAADLVYRYALSFETPRPSGERLESPLAHAAVEAEARAHGWDDESDTLAGWLHGRLSRPSGEREAEIEPKREVKTDTNLLQKSVSDRDAHPWRYYRLDHETMTRIANELSGRVASLRASLEAARELVGVTTLCEQLCGDGLTADNQPPELRAANAVLAGSAPPTSPDSAGLLSARKWLAETKPDPREYRGVDGDLPRMGGGTAGYLNALQTWNEAREYLESPPTGAPAPIYPRIEDMSATYPRLDGDEVAAALGAEPVADAPAPVQAEMPAIEVGDWIEDDIRIRPVTEDTVSWWNNSAEALGTLKNVTEIRKANGTVWVRPTGQETP